MGRRSVTRQQVSGHRFLTRRMEYALVCRDTRMLDDPIRGQGRALAGGVAITAIALAVCAVLALLRPHGTLGQDPIVVVRESGAVYVRVGDTVHPALNLASARLIARTPAQPRLVSAAMIADARTGPMMGIPGAPGTLDPVLTGEQLAWTVCEGGPRRRTVLSIGAPEHHRGAPPVLVTARGSNRTYLLHDGYRVAVDMRDRAVVTAFRLDGLVPLHVSRAVVDILPEGDPLRVDATPAGADFDGVLCARWMWTGTGRVPDTAVFTAKTPADEPDSIELVQADGAGPHLDAVIVPAGHSVYAHAAGVAGDGAMNGPRYLITGAGVAFGIGDDESAEALGLPQVPVGAPWPVLASLPRGPELSIDRATLVRDSVAAP
ncbi:type VII secretion protein EccB [Mycobacterium sp. NPDC003323]